MTDHLTSIEDYRRMVARGTSEEELLATVAEHLTLGQWRWHHVRRSDKAVQMGDPGLPDILAVRGDVLLVRELKAAGGRYEIGQREWLDALSAVRRVDVGTWRPSNLDAITEVLAR